MKESVKELVKSIDKNRTQASSSKSDEISVMRAMLNDDTYEVKVFSESKGEITTTTYSPYNDARELITNIISDATSISKSEASELSKSYEFGKQAASIMVNLSKEFINTYLDTGRKLPLGGREKSNISIKQRVKEETISSYPIKVGVNADGTDKYDRVTGEKIPEHNSLKVYSSCPSWLK